MAADWNYLRRFAEDPDFQNPKRLRDPLDVATFPDYNPKKQVEYSQRAQAIRIGQQNAARAKADNLAQIRASQVGARTAAAEQRRQAVLQNRQKAKFLLGAGGALGGWAGRVHDRVAMMPAPGGIGMLVVILLGLLFFLVPVQGKYTRAQLLWETLLGHTSIGTSDYGPPEWHAAGGTAASGPSSPTAPNPNVVPGTNVDPSAPAWTTSFEVPPAVGVNGF